MTFPLVPRGRLIGVSFGSMQSFRRGSGTDVSGSRPYRTGDDIRTIDWAASARVSAARQRDEFVVRERYADEAPRVIVVCDRRPAMSFFAAPLPWLDKRAALIGAAELILESSIAAGGFVGYLDYADGAPRWDPPRGRRLAEVKERLPSAAFAAPSDTVERAVAHLTEHGRAVPQGSFVFVLSDFIPAPPADAWLTALEHRWDICPVVIQDPTWEQSFPDVSGIAVPLRTPGAARAAPARLTAGEVRARRGANEERLQRLLDGFRDLEREPVLVSSSDRVEILASFLAWAEVRRARRAQ